MIIFKALYSRLDNAKNYYLIDNEDIEADTKTASDDKYCEAIALLNRITIETNYNSESIVKRY